MKNLVKLLYAHEHHACSNYIRKNNVGFTTLKLKKGEQYYLELEDDFAILFVMSGKIAIDSPSSRPIVVEKNELCLLTHYFGYALNVTSDVNVTVMYFNRPNSRCDLLVFENMAAQIDNDDPAMIRKLKMIKPVFNFVAHMGFYLDNNMYCKHLHDIKESEFFFILRGFYRKEDIAYFFAPVVKSLSDFANKVKSNYMNVETVSELAGSLHMTTKTFTRRFKTVFDVTPKQWMLQEKSKYVSNEQDAAPKMRANFTFSSE